MGHYYSEMACSTCGNIPCKCPKQEDKTKKMWVVDHTDLQVMTVEQFDRKHTFHTSKTTGIATPGNPFMMRMGYEMFETKQEAMDHRVVVVDKQISQQKKKMHEAAVQIQTLEMKKEQL